MREGSSLPMLRMAAVKVQATDLVIPRDAAGRAVAAAWCGRPGWLLVHLDDQVVWRAVQPEQIEAAIAALDLGRVQELRLFEPDLEIRAWRTETGLRWVSVTERPGGALVGVHERAYLLGDGRGAVEKVGTHLHVRHYHHEDPETGLLRLARHRWLKVEGGTP